MPALLAIALLAPVIPAAAAPAVSPAALVRRLGSESYQDRLTAEKELLALGLHAIPALEAGGEDADLEVRRRCQSLLKKLRPEQRAERLRAMRAGNMAGSFSLWDHFRRVFGSGSEALAFFADMYEKEGELFEEIDLALRRRDHWGQELHQDQVERLTRLFANRPVREAPRKAPPGLPAKDHLRIAAALLIGFLPGVTLSDEGWYELTLPLHFHIPFRRESARSKDARGELVRKLLGRWCLAARSDAARWTALWTVLAQGLGEPGRDLARRIQTDSNSPQLLAGAACVLGHHGRDDDIPRLLPLLKRTENYHKQLQGIQVADVALEALVRLTGQKVSDYGTTRSTPLFTDTYRGKDGGEDFAVLAPCYPVAIYKDAASRQAAFRKWQEWAKDNPRRLEARR